MRKYYIDNLRVFCILLLFPFHTAMIFNNWGEAFYIHGEESFHASFFTVCVYPWWMTLLFVIAGMSSYFALSNRNVKEFAKERTNKLLIPLLVGLVTIVPIQTYVADVFHNGYDGNFFEHYAVYFTRFTDLTGYDGGFTPAHLWFMLYLFVISMCLLSFMKKYINGMGKHSFDKMTYVPLFLLFLVVLICTPILDIGKSVGEAMACFAIGFFIFSSDEVQETLQKKVWISGALTFVFLVIRLYMWLSGNDHGMIWDIEYRLYLWSGILFLLGLAKRYFNQTNKLMSYLSVAAFPLYYFHQTILVVLGYFVLKKVDIMWIQYVIICVGTFILSLLCYEVCRRNRITAKLFGIKMIQGDAHRYTRNRPQ